MNPNVRPPARRGGAVLVAALRQHGVDTVFSVPGESFLPALDALYQARSEIRLITCRQEGAAGHMAEAYAKLTGRPGVCLVTRGPGATHASIAVHTARQDSTPLILLVGQVSRRMLGREAWQELDIPAVFGSLTKWATQIDRADRIPEIVSRAFHVATSGRPGPVVIAAPEDLLYETVEVADAPAYRPVRTHAGAEDLARLSRMIAEAKRPIMLLGGSGWSPQAYADLQRFAERFDLPVCTGFRRQDRFDNRHPNYAGDLGIAADPALVERVRQSDLIVCVGSRMSETTTAGYTLLEVPRPRQRLVHVHPDAGELGRVYQADLAINADLPAFAAAVAGIEAPARIPWSDRTRQARAAYEANLAPVPMPGPVNLAEIVAHLRERLAPDAIVTNGAGNYSGWVHRFYCYRGFRTQLAPTSGVMGYGLPAAIAAAVARPGRQIVCFAGDGCFQMSAQELATVRQFGLKLIVIVVNNGMYGSIRMHQEVHFPGHVHGTDLQNPDFAMLARSYGLRGELVTETAAFADAFTRALQADVSTVLELRVDPEAITPRTTLTALRERAERSGH
ncbi:MAG: thiamine pyrophosphate-binding protein [Lautropia sp.]